MIKQRRDLEVGGEREACTQTMLDQVTDTGRQSQKGGQRDWKGDMHTNKNLQTRQKRKGSSLVSHRASTEKLKEEKRAERKPTEDSGRETPVCLQVSLSFHPHHHHRPPPPPHYSLPFERLLYVGTTWTQLFILHPFKAGINISTL
jgi:hypothetical protein